MDFEREAIGLDDVLIDGGARGGVKGLDEDAAAPLEDAAMAPADPSLIELELAVGFAADDEILIIDRDFPVPATTHLDEFDIHHSPPFGMIDPGTHFCQRHLVLEGRCGVVSFDNFCSFRRA